MKNLDLPSQTNQNQISQQLLHVALNCNARQVPKCWQERNGKFYQRFYSAKIIKKKKVIRCLDAQMPFLLNREAKKMLSVRSFADHQEILRMI